MLQWVQLAARAACTRVPVAPACAQTQVSIDIRKGLSDEQAYKVVEGLKVRAQGGGAPTLAFLPGARAVSTLDCA